MPPRRLSRITEESLPPPLWVLPQDAAVQGTSAPLRFYDSQNLNLLVKINKSAFVYG